MEKGGFANRNEKRFWESPKNFKPASDKSKPFSWFATTRTTKYSDFFTSKTIAVIRINNPIGVGLNWKLVLDITLREQLKCHQQVA